MSVKLYKISAEELLKAVSLIEKAIEESTEIQSKWEKDSNDFFRGKKLNPGEKLNGKICSKNEH